MVSREELYRLVWAQPMTRVAAGLGVSGSYLARVCIALRVPRPERGYWAKLQAGKAPYVPPLPAPRVGDLQEWAKDVPLPPAPVAESDTAGPGLDRKSRRIVSKTHELIGGARKHFEKTRRIEAGEYLKPYKAVLVDVTVTSAQLLRALEVANALFNALEARGHRVTLAHPSQPLGRATIEVDEVPRKREANTYRPRWAPRDPTVVYIGEVPVGLALVELSEAVLMRWVNGGYIRDADYSPLKAKRFLPDHTWTSMQDIPSGRLRLIAYAPRHDVECSMLWQESKGGSLLNKIPEIVSALPAFAIKVGEQLRAAEQAWQLKLKEWDEAEERRLREEDLRKVKASQEESRKHLERIIADWARAISLEQFFGGIEARVATLPEDEARPIMQRLELARGFVGSLDPMQFFLAWRTPLERHRPIYDHEADSQHSSD